MLNAREGLRELVVGLNQAEDLRGMIHVDSGEYQWALSGKEGGPTSLFEVPAFQADEYLVTFADFRLFLEESENPVSPNWPDDLELIQTLHDRPVVFLEASDMAAYAAWNGKRLITLPEFRLASGGPDLARFPQGVEPIIGHETMPFDAIAQNQIPKEDIPADWGEYWYWMTLVLPSVNEVEDYDQGPSGMKMIWATVKQMTESPAYFNPEVGSPSGNGRSTLSDRMWVVGTSKLAKPSKYLTQGLEVMDAQWRAAPDYFTSFRCALSDNSIP